MKNYLTFGPLSVRLSRKHLAPWGYPFIEVGGLSLFSRENTGNLMLAVYHPRSSITWLWCVSLAKADPSHPIVSRSKHRFGQWHDYYRVPLTGWGIRIGHQRRMTRSTVA